MSDRFDFIFGTLAGGAAVGIGVLCYYGLNTSSRKNHRVQNSEEWPTYVRNRVNKTFVYLGGGLCLTAGTAILVNNSPKLMNMLTNAMTESPFLTLIGLTAANVGTVYICQTTPYESQSMTPKHAAWALHCGLNGLMLAPLGFIGGPILFQAAQYTGGIIGGFAAVAACAPDKRFLNWGGFLGMGLGIVCVSSLGAMFCSRTSSIGEALDSVSLYGGLGLFSLFLLYDTQSMITRAEKYPRYNPTVPYDPINEQIQLYLDSLNIFIRIARILYESDKKKKNKV